MYCPKCGNEIEEDARFCGHCGYGLVKGKEEAALFKEKKEDQISGEEIKKTRGNKEMGTGTEIAKKIGGILFVFIIISIIYGGLSGHYGGIKGTEQLVADIFFIVIIFGIFFWLLDYVGKRKDKKEGK